MEHLISKFLSTRKNESIIFNVSYDFDKIVIIKILENLDKLGILSLNRT